LTGERVQFATATQWVAQLAEAKRQNTPEAEIKKTSLISLIAVDEIG
jgi:DNA replication protein DnaC